MCVCLSVTSYGAYFCLSSVHVSVCVCVFCAIESCAYPPSFLHLLALARDEPQLPPGSWSWRQNCATDLARGGKVRGGAQWSKESHVEAREI